MANTGDLLAELLIGHGVRYVFGIPGGQSLPLYSAITRRDEDIKHILVRDERTGAYAADAYARVTGRLAACDAVPGPGVVKLPTGLFEAQATSVPIVAIAADLAAKYRPFAPYGSAAQGLDQVALLRPVSKAVIEVDTQEAIPEAVRRGFREATTGRPGPIVLNIPADVFAADWDRDSLPAAPVSRYGIFPAERPRPSHDAVLAAGSILRDARRPLLAVGGGVLLSQATDELVRLAEALSIPIVTTVTGKGAIAESHPLSAGVLGSQYGEECANQAMREADVVFLVGFKSSQQSTYAWVLPTSEQRVIHLDIDPYEVGKVFQTEVALIGDARAGLDDLHRLLGGFEAERTGWVARTQSLRANWDAEIVEECQPGEKITPQQVMSELQRLLPDDAVLVSDASFSIGWLASYYDVPRAGRHCLFPRGSATLGAGLAMSIGARLGIPAAAPVVCITGDGGISYALGELGTCRKYDLDVVVVVLNNSCLGYTKVDALLGEQQYEHADFPETNFAEIGRAFGCRGLRVEDPQSLGKVLADALSQPGPTVVDIVVDEWQTPELQLRESLKQAAPEAVK